MKVFTFVFTSRAAQRRLKAPPGFEPGMEVLQTGYSPHAPIHQINNLQKSFGNSRPFALTTITRITLDSLAIGQVWDKWAERDLAPRPHDHAMVIRK